ncbi:recombinase family protein [Amycolatopsis sp. cmx-8-4]|uniref:recombinase family protein n=1 Tax=Amycolatopsis sp. cmx-8-4 TaxID=2790947 RepID=UPI003979C180
MTLGVCSGAAAFAVFTLFANGFLVLAPNADMFPGTRGRQAMLGTSAPKALRLGDLVASGAFWWVTTAAVNETISVSGSRAQRILQRRINQSVAEYEVLNTLEQSWGGLCTHVREGWNIGKPCYGYKAKAFRHPNPAKAAKGITKTRLEPDGPCGETVTQIAAWVYYDHLGTDVIADLLNQDLVKHPPPSPPGGRRARGCWSRSSINDILRNPKYTGYQVYNRRATRSGRGKHNDPIKWVWSPEPAHEPLIPKWMYDELIGRRQSKQRSRASNAPNSHPQTKRTYLFRGRVFCPCGRRMVGEVRRERAYYLCRPSNNNCGRPDNYLGHPKTLYLREDALLDAVAAFLADRVFGPERRAILDAQLAGMDTGEADERDAQRTQLQKAMDGLVKKQESVLGQRGVGPQRGRLVVPSSRRQLRRCLGLLRFGDRATDRETARRHQHRTARPAGATEGQRPDQDHEEGRPRRHRLHARTVGRSSTELATTVSRVTRRCVGSTTATGCPGLV